MRKKNKNRTKTRIRYDQRVALETEYGNGVICGYARKFYLINNHIKSRCSLSGDDCYRNLAKRIKPCRTYTKWLAGRQAEMRENGLGHLIDEVEE